MLKKQWMLILIVFSLSGCHRSVKYTVPPVEAPSKFPSSAKTDRHLRDLPYLKWWQQFKDPQLNQLIEQGLNKNLDIHIAVHNLERARGELQEVKLSWIPNLSTLAGYSTNPALGIPGGFYGLWPYYFVNLLQLYQQQKLATYQVNYQQALLESYRLTLIGQLSSAYFTLIAQKEQLKLLQALDTDLKALVQFNRKDLQIGLASQINVADALTQEALVSAQLKIAEHNIVVSENALRFLLDENPGSYRNLYSFNHYQFLPFNPGSLPVCVLQNRPDLKMAEWAVLAANQGVSLAYSEFFPKLTLDQFVGEGHLPDNTFEDLTDSYFTWTVQPSTFGRIKARRGVFKAKVAEYVKTLRQILREVDNDFSANHHNKAYYQAISTAENEYRQQFKLQKGLLKFGLISDKLLLENKITLDNLALTKNQAKLQLALTLVKLYQDLAGGYKVT